jgi:paraquat-inducible protein A
MTAAKVRKKYLPCEICEYPVEFSEGLTLECGRCGHRTDRAKPKSARATLAFSLTALIFYFPAMIFPFMHVEMYGNISRSNVWQGIVSLAEAGSYFVAAVVFLASILIPFLKLVILFYLSFTATNGQSQRLKTALYRFVEGIGRWSMLDIFLLAILVALLKLGHWTSVKPEIGSLFFLLVVIFTMLASAFFDPKLIWEGEDAAAF